MSGSGNNVLTIVLNEQGAAHIYAKAQQVSDPTSSEYANYLTRAELDQYSDPPSEGRKRCEQWFEERNMMILDRPTPQMLLLEATDDELAAAFGDDYMEWLKLAGNGGSPRGRWGLPPDISGYIKAIHLHTVDSLGELSLLSHGIDPSRGEDTMDNADRAPVASSIVIPTDLGGFSVDDIRAIYEYPEPWDGTGETIALLNLAGVPDNDDLQTFWRASRIDRDNPEHVNIGGEREEPPSFLAKLEATMGAAWIGALAPGAKLVVYNVNTSTVADPWSTMVAVAVDDKENRPTILVSTWTTPEVEYYRRHGARVFSDLMRQATVLGMTMVVATGDWGVYSGRPDVRRGRRQAVAAAWPHGVFPAVEDQVLAVGGTMITSRRPLTEVAWSGPLPPNKALRDAMPFRLFATSGGFSQQVPLPQWQTALMGPGSTFSRGSNIPAVMPFGRGYPDVALMAAGPSVQLDANADLSSIGYQLVVENRWINYAGGTSVAAPLWATIIARMNQARQSRGGRRVGFANPLLYQIAHDYKGTPDNSPFRDITSGNSDVILDAVFQEGAAQRYRLQGYDAQGMWDPVTGLGVPRVSRLIDIVSKG
ncbi:S53 family peptidase [Haliangium sp.]|uniref:S53 family peptidase n=1 Tax=Haliangium sp. TaxID=2663208 RepID=UPI003D133758